MKEEHEEINGNIPPVDPSENEISRLHEWLTSENREPAQTAFTAGPLRNLAKEMEFREYRVPSKEEIKKSRKSFITSVIARFFKLAHITY